MNPSYDICDSREGSFRPGVNSSNRLMRGTLVRFPEQVEKTGESSSDDREARPAPVADQMLPAMTVKMAESEEDRDRIYRFRYEIYVDEMGKNPLCADHDRRLLRDELDAEGLLLYVEDADGRVIGTSRAYIADVGKVPPHLRMVFSLHRFDTFPGCRVSLSGRAMVAPQYRGTSLMVKVFLRHVAILRERGVDFDFFQCRPSLIRFYEKLGCRRYGDNFVDPEVGYQVPLVTLMQDIEYFQSIRSPLLAVVNRYPNSRASSEWFSAVFSPSDIVSPVVSEDRFRHFLEDHRLDRDVPLFVGLTEQHIEAFLSECTVLRCRPGDLIVRQNDVSSEMFVMLSGTAEVRRGNQGKERIVTTLSQGDVFGEMAFVRLRPRSATVEATSSAEVLVLNPHFFQRMIKKMPEISAHVLFNLSKLLCDRLDRTTSNWIGSDRAVNAA